MLKNSLRSTLLFALLATTIFSATAQQPNSENVISLQMYTLRNVGQPDAQFAMAQKAGFHHVELVGDQGLDTPTLSKQLKAHELTVSSSHIQLSLLEKDYEQIVKQQKTIGNHYIVVPWIEPADRPLSTDGWIAYAKRLDIMGSRLKKDGLQLAYHNHNFEMKKYGGKTILEIILDHAAADNLKLEMDVAWVSRGGFDPVYFLNKYPDRIFAIHAKDNAGIGVRDDEMNFAPLGEGLLDWDSILPAAKKAGIKWFIVEHDAPKDPYKIITESHQNLKQKLDSLVQKK